VVPGEATPAVKKAAAATALVLLLVLPLSLVGVVIAAGEEVAPSDKALAEIPGELLALYRAASATCEGLDWTVLAAIHKVETNFGTGRVTSSAGAQGPMQFMPATWRAYGVNGNHDGRRDVNDVVDAVFGAANLLCANGAGDPARLPDALWNYNHSDEYVAQVLALATSYGVVSMGGLAASASPSAVLNNPRIVLSENARADLEAGLVDPRLVAILETVARRHSLAISVFKSGHSIRTSSGSISNHFYGRAVDIYAVDGLTVSHTNGAARLLLLSIASLPKQLRPTELGHPFGNLPILGGFSDAAHGDHLHIGFD
jgi:hypothetical protein